MKRRSLSTLGLAGILFAAPPALAANMDVARDLLKEGRFAEAREALWPLALSGNAEAEELIGVIFGMGLGVPRDPVRAFDWHLRSALKGHPRAQSALGWHYETGLGIAAPDRIRAYLWYRLAEIGGDPEAGQSLEKVTAKMTQGEIEKAHELVRDYEVWLYPRQ